MARSAGYEAAHAARPSPRRRRRTRPARREPPRPGRDRRPPRAAPLRTRGVRQPTSAPPETGLPAWAQLVLARDLLHVDLRDRLVDEAPLVVLVEDLAGHLLRGEQGQLDDVAADLLAKPCVLGLELLLVLLEPVLQVGVGLLSRLLELTLGL